MLSCYFRALRHGGVLTSPQAAPSGLQMTPPSLPGTENPGKHGSPDFILILLLIHFSFTSCSSPPPPPPPLPRPPIQQFSSSFSSPITVTQCNIYCVSFPGLGSFLSSFPTFINPSCIFMCEKGFLLYPPSITFLQLSFWSFIAFSYGIFYHSIVKSAKQPYALPFAKKIIIFSNTFLHPYWNTTVSYIHSNIPGY